MVEDPLLEASRTAFPRPITLEEGKDLLLNLALGGEYRIEVNERRAWVINTRGDGHYFSRNSASLSGMISNDEALTGFEFGREIGRLELDRFSYLDLTRTPGYSLEEHSKRDRALWADLKQRVLTYFE